MLVWPLGASCSLAIQCSLHAGVRAAGSILPRDQGSAFQLVFSGPMFGGYGIPKPNLMGQGSRQRSQDPRAAPGFPMGLGWPPPTSSGGGASRGSCWRALNKCFKVPLHWGGQVEVNAQGGDPQEIAAQVGGALKEQLHDLAENSQDGFKL